MENAIEIDRKVKHAFNESHDTTSNIRMYVGQCDHLLLRRYAKIFNKCTVPLLNELI